jgi:hypothetical protein
MNLPPIGASRQFPNGARFWADEWGSVVVDVARRRESEILAARREAALSGQNALERASLALAIADLWLASAALVLAQSKSHNLFAKWGDAWQDQPRVPAGNPNGGRWTTEDSRAASPSPSAREERAKPELPISDGVYRPGTDRPQVSLTGGGSAEESRPASEPPPDVRTLESIFPGLRTNSAAEILLAPVDAFIGFSEAADAANLEATMGQYKSLVEDIKRLDPTFADQELLPEGGIAGLSWEGRANLIDGLRMRLASLIISRPATSGLCRARR